MDANFFALYAIALSAVFAALSYWAKTRHERRRMTRVVLYHLLEMHHQIRRSHFGLKNYEAEFLKECQRALAENGVAMSGQEAALLKETLAPLLKAYIAQELQSLAAEMSEPFEQALSDLSREDPMLAFMLRGRDQLMMFMRDMESFLAKAVPNHAAVLGATPLGALAIFDGVLVPNVVLELEHALKATAWRCDVVTLVRVRLLLRRVTREEHSVRSKLLADMVDQMIPLALAEHRAVAPLAAGAQSSS